MNSFGNALSFLSMIVIVNVVLVLLYKRGHYNIIQAWMMTGTTILLFLTSYYYMGRIAFYFNLPLDHLSWSVFIWNVGVTGITALYYGGPFFMQQGYLVYVSVLMAMVLEESFPEWTSWILLVLVSIWDVFAVLCIVGPLRILLETAKERNEPLFPALVFSTSTAWCYAADKRSISMAPPGTSSVAAAAAMRLRADKAPTVPMVGSESMSETQGVTKNLTSEGPDLLRRRVLLVPSSHDEEEIFDSWSNSPDFKQHLVVYDELSKALRAACVRSRKAPKIIKASDPNSSTSATSGTDGDKGTSSGPSGADYADEEEGRGLPSTRMPNSEDAGGALDSDPQDAHPGPSDVPVVHPSQGGKGPRNSRGHRTRRHRNTKSTRQQEILDDASSEGGMKMGLGDFIFYSVLVGKASRHGTGVTVLACYVAVIVGILLTLFLLVLLQKPLPALPFSISLGIIAYFSSVYLTEPFLDDMDALAF
ncbi:presenilin-1-like [Amblyomma americanum]